MDNILSILLSHRMDTMVEDMMLDVVEEGQERETMDLNICQEEHTMDLMWKNFSSYCTTNTEEVVISTMDDLEQEMMTSLEPSKEHHQTWDILEQARGMKMRRGRKDKVHNWTRRLGDDNIEQQTYNRTNN